MFGRRRAGRAAHGPAPYSAQAAGHAVRDAEQFVRGAWELELLRQRDHLRFALRAAYEDRDTAYARMVEAQRVGDPKKIAAAHTALETAVEAARASELDCDQVRRKLRAELDLLNRTSRKHAISALVHHLEHDGSAITAQLSTSQRAPIRQVRTVLVMPRPKSPRTRWLNRLLMRRTASRGTP